jgi:hypothetical protein
MPTGWTTVKGDLPADRSVAGAAKFIMFALAPRYQWEVLRRPFHGGRGV